MDAPPEDKFLVPYSAGIPGTVRIIYAPTPRPITVHQLESDKRYRASYFDPVTGRRADVGAAQPDAKGSWTVAPPRSAKADWVLVLEKGDSKNP